LGAARRRWPTRSRAAFAACSIFRQTWLDRLRAAKGSAVGVTVHADPAGQAESWLNGTGDLLFAGLGEQVPLAVQLGVLAHADIGRLADLGRHCRGGSVRRAWGTPMAGMAGDIAQHAGTAEALAELQRDVLQPLELELLAGRVSFTASSDLIAYLRCRLSASEFRPFGHGSGADLGDG
jgi:hypothetical protein